MELYKSNKTVYSRILSLIMVKLFNKEDIILPMSCTKLIVSAGTFNSCIDYLLNVYNFSFPILLDLPSCKNLDFYPIMTTYKMALPPEKLTDITPVKA